MRWALSIVLLAGCDAPAIGVARPDASADATTDGEAFDRLFDDIARQECAQMAKCSPSEFKAFYGDDATCRARTRDAVARQLSGWGVTATVEARRACVAADEGATCEQRMRRFFQGERPTACQFRGSLDDGASCGGGTQCKSGRCTGTCGRCVTPAGAGKPCTGDAPCDRGLLCHEGTCVRPRERTETCSKTEPCSVDLSCVGGRCVPSPLEGQPCAEDPDRPCALGRNNHCDPSTKKCTPIPIVGRGERCGFTPEQTLIFCAHGLACATPIPTQLGTCVPAVPDGAACGGSYAWPGPCLPPANCIANVCRLHELVDCSLPVPPP